MTLEVLRYEKKYLIDQPQFYRLGSRLASVMHADPNNRGDGYVIRSPYFDSIDDRDYFEKLEGIEVRRKIRLRTYGPGSTTAKLEMKQKEGALQKKRSVTLPREQAERLVRGDYGVLLTRSEPLAHECYAMMATHCYLPRSIVEYRRKAFIASENKTRVTLDHHIVATEANFDLFSATLPLYPVLDPLLAVLEVKYNGFLISYIKDLLSDAGTDELSVGKYSLSRSVGLHYTF